MLIYFRYVRRREDVINFFRFEKSIFGICSDLETFETCKKIEKIFFFFFIEIFKGFKIQNSSFLRFFLRSEKIFKIHFFSRSLNIRNFDFF